MLSGYLVATVLFAVAGMIGLTIRVSLSLPAPAEVVGKSNSRGQQPPGATEADGTAAGEKPLVARITGMADCRWGNPKTPRPPTSPWAGVALSSGLVEITYQSGAKVILQGPCTYEVDSPAAASSRWAS